jgi:hypothetical protein
VVLFDDLLDSGESDARTGGIANVATPLESIEDVREISGRDPYPFILDRENRPPLLLWSIQRGESQRDIPFTATVFDGVVEKVMHHPLQPGPVPCPDEFRP